MAGGLPHPDRRYTVARRCTANLLRRFWCGSSLATKDWYTLFHKVAPVMEAGATERRVCLPSGTKWTDAYTKKVYEGGNYVTVQAPIDVIPVFMREGTSYAIYE